MAGEQAATLSEPGGGERRPGQGQVTAAQGLVSGQQSGDIIMFYIYFTVINMLQEIIDPEWERIVENHRRDREATERGRARGRETRSTIWDYKQPQAKSEQEAAAARAEVSAPADEKCSSGNGVFSFVPATNSAPQPSSPEVIRVDSEPRQSRQSRGEGQERRSRLSAFQQIWPQTYNSFQNRAVSANTCAIFVFISFWHLF